MTALPDLPDQPTLAAAQTVVIKGDVAANVARHVALAGIAARQGAKLILFPELSLTGYEPELAGELALRADDACLAPLREAAAAHGIVITAGAPLVGDGGLPLIAALTFRPDGNTAVYTKQYLHGGEETAFAAGQGGAMLDVEGAAIALAVCADFGQPAHALAAAQAGAHVYAASVLVSVKGYDNDAALLQGHAAAHAMPVLMANHGGPSGGWHCAGRSAVWDEKGRLVVAAPGAGECLLLAGRSGGVWNGRVLDTGA